MKEEMRTIGYLCPACHKRVIQQRSVFALSASGAVVSCECGESSLTIEAEENKFRLSVPCGVCGEEHLAECSADKLLHGRGIGLACSHSKNNSCCTRNCVTAGIYASLCCLAIFFRSNNALMIINVKTSS